MKKTLTILFIAICGIATAAPIRSMMAARSTINQSKPDDRMVQVQWLESTGTQYILLTNLLVNGIDIEIRPQRVDRLVWGSVGRWNGSSRADTISYRTDSGDLGWNIRNTDNNGNIVSALEPWDFLEISIHGTSTKIGDNEYAMGASWGRGNYERKFALWGCYINNSLSVDKVFCRIGKCDLYSNNILAYSLIPVRIGRVGYMYDTISGEVFGNQGTGNFVVGPDL